MYNITQLSCLELWLLWCCLDSSRFCKQPGLALQHKVQCGPYHILYLEAVNVVRSGSAALGPISRDEGLPSLLQARVTLTRTQALSTHWYLPFSKLFFPQWQVLVLISSFKGRFLLDSLLRVNLDLLSSFFFLKFLLFFQEFQVYYIGGGVGKEICFLGSCCPNLMAWRRQHQCGWLTSSIQRFIPKVIFNASAA